MRKKQEQSYQFSDLTLLAKKAQELNLIVYEIEKLIQAPVEEGVILDVDGLRLKADYAQLRLKLLMKGIVNFQDKCYNKVTTLTQQRVPRHIHFLIAAQEEQLEVIQRRLKEIGNEYLRIDAEMDVSNECVTLIMQTKQACLLEKYLVNLELWNDCFIQQRSEYYLKQKLIRQTDAEMDLVNKDLEVASYFLKEAVNIEKIMQDVNLFLEAKREAVPETEVQRSEVKQVSDIEQQDVSADNIHYANGEAQLDGDHGGSDMNLPLKEEDGQNGN